MFMQRIVVYLVSFGGAFWLIFRLQGYFRGVVLGFSLILELCGRVFVIMCL